MKQGSITKIVKTFGSRWGKIRPLGDPREIFFNAASFDEAVDFASLEVGQDVEFVERADHATGSYAWHVVVATASPVVRV